MTRGPDRQTTSSALRTVEQARQALKSIYQADVEIEGAREPDFFVEVSTTEASPVSLWDIHTNGGQTYDMRSGLDDIFVKIRSQGGYTIDTRDDRYALSHATGLVLVPKQAIRYSTADATALSTLRISRPAFEAGVAAYSGRCPPEWCGIEAFPIRGGFGQLMQALMSRYRENYADQSDCLYSETSLKLLQDAAIIAVAELIARGSDVERNDKLTASRQNVMRGMEMVNTQTAPLTIHDLAAELGISVRALQVGFRKHLNASPHNVLKTGRIEGARRDLMAGRVKSVREAAIKWGFSNLARFSNEYHAVTGECPKAALRKLQDGED